MGVPAKARKAKKAKDEEANTQVSLEIVRLRNMGYSNAQISNMLEISGGSVSKAIKRATEQWKRDMGEEYATLIAREMAANSTVMQEYYEAWVRSKSGEDEEKEGNPAFMQGVERCIDRRIKLYGINPPVKVAPVTPDGQESYKPVTYDQAEVNFLSVMAEIEQIKSGNNRDLDDGK